MESAKRMEVEEKLNGLEKNIKHIAYIFMTSAVELNLPEGGGGSLDEREAVKL